MGLTGAYLLGLLTQESSSHTSPIHYGKVTLETSSQAPGTYAGSGKGLFSFYSAQS